MDKTIFTECTKILKQLNKNPESNPFKSPVDYKLLQLPDYPNIIKNPMDLGTIESNLKQKKYKSHKDFFDDIQLVWNNCKLYNQEGSLIYQQAINLEQMTTEAKQQVETLIKKLSSIGLQQQSSQNPSGAQGIAAKQKKTEKSVSSSIIKKKISKNKEGSSSITVNTNTNINSIVGSNNAAQQQTIQSTTQYTKKERVPPPNKGEQQQDKYANQQERKYAHISLRLNLAFKLKNASEDKLVNLFAMLAEKHSETLANIENREQKLSINLTSLPDQTIQNMIAALEFKD